MTDVCLVYSTFATRHEAISVVKILLEEQLIACANISAAADSLYRWEGQIQHANEVIMWAKTRHSLLEKLIVRIKNLHSYEVPCILSLPIESGHAPFLQWIKDSTDAGVS